MLIPAHVPATTLEAHDYFRDAQLDQQRIDEAKTEEKQKEIWFMESWIEDRMDFFFNKFPHLLGNIELGKLHGIRENLVKKRWNEARYDHGFC